MADHNDNVAVTFELGGDLRVNRLGFGAMRLTGSRVWGESAAPENREEAEKVLHRSPVIVPIPGTSSVDHLEENVAAACVSLVETETRALDAV